MRERVQRDALTIVVSRIDIIIPTITTPEITHTWGSILSAAAELDGLISAVRRHSVPKY